jgi:cellulose synthase/poly-beta-1,6-N-acetylglucosamine synthase-like glycosyltransferase
MNEINYFPKTSLIITVFNEENNIRKLLLALKKQTVMVRELIIVDGGSTDRTWDILKAETKKWPELHIFLVPGNRSVGRNFGVNRAHFPIIVFTDAGCTPENDWLEEITRPFLDSKIMVVSGYYRGLPQNLFQSCLVPFVLVMPDRVNKYNFLPSTRSMAIRRSAWNKSGGFDPKLTHNEDYAFAKWLEKMGFKFFFAPDAVVGWQPRKNLRQASWMFTRFAIGDIQAGLIRPRIKFLFMRYLLFIYLVMLTIQIHTLFWPLLAITFAYFIWSIAKNYKYIKKMGAIFWLPVLQVTADFSVMFGTLVGFISKAFGLL